MPDVKVVLADNHTLNLEGMASLLEDVPDVEVGAAVSAAGDLVNSLRTAQPDVLVIDARMLNELSDQELARVRKAVDDLKVIILTEQDSAARAAAFAPPETKGLVFRTTDSRSLADAIRSVASGRLWDMPSSATNHRETAARGRGLSPRELDIAILISQGLTNREIAQRLGLSEQSVKNLVSRILKKKGLTNRVQIALERWSSGKE